MKVSICGVPYEITGHSDYRDLNIYKYDGGVVGGRITMPEFKIQVWTDKPKEAIGRTFLHELIHGIAHDLHIEELMDDDGNQDEGVVIRLSVAMNEALRSLGINIEDYIWDKNEQTIH